MSRGTDAVGEGGRRVAWWRWPVRGVLMAASFYGLGFLAGCVAVNRMMFWPQPSSYRDTGETIKVTTEDGVRISALHLPNADAEYTILFSHGNAEDLGDLRPFFERLRHEGFSVFAYDYHGYGTSEGKPTEPNARRDVDAAYAYLRDELAVPPGKIIAHGRSLGGGLAVYLAAREPVGGLIVESSFVSAFRVVTRIPLLPGDRLKSLSRIDRVGCPVLIIHGTRDRVIPDWHGRKLFDRAREPKMALWIEGAGHNDLLPVAGDAYWRKLSAFRKLVAEARSASP